MVPFQISSRLSQAEYNVCGTLGVDARSVNAIYLHEDNYDNNQEIDVVQVN